jgi:glutathione S-transferase
MVACAAKRRSIGAGRYGLSARIVWLCKELRLDYALRRYERRADNRLAPDKYKVLHPMGIAPVITDGDLVLGESSAICDYICACYGEGRLTPGRDDPDFAEHLFWFHWSNGTFMTTLMMQLVLATGGEGNTTLVFVEDRSAPPTRGRWPRPSPAWPRCRPNPAAKGAIPQVAQDIVNPHMMRRGEPHE